MNKTLCLLSNAFMVMQLAGCGSAPTRIYTLQSVAAQGAPSSYDGPPLRVAAVHFPPDIDRIEIVTERSEGEFRINDNDHWAAPLGKLAQETLSADLLSRLPAGKLAFPRLPAAGTTAELRVEILRLPSGGTTGIVASWQLTVDPHTVHSGIVDLPDEPRSGAADQVAHGLSILLARLADQIAGQLPANISIP